MVNSKPALKNRVFGISVEQDELLKLYSSRKGISISELIRICVSQKIEKLKIEEEKFWRKLSVNKLDEILSSLTDYLNLKLSGNDPRVCEHSSLWENNYDVNFTHTKKFCRNLQIELNAFMKRIEADFQIDFGCECELYENLKNRRNNEDE